MKIFLFILLFFTAAVLTAQEHFVWIEADPDTIYFDDNLTYSTITALLEDDDNNPVSGAWVYFDSDIGNLLHSVQTDENGIAETTFWESGDLGVATISVERNGLFLETQVTIIMPVSVKEDELLSPVSNLRNYPNPFNPSTTIEFSLNPDYNGDVDLVIYNSLGQIVKTFSDLPIAQSANFQITWSGTNDADQPVSSGVYFYQIKAGVFKETKKMMLMK